MQILRIVIAFVGFSFIVLASHAWDAAGHRVVAYIAWQQMTPEARTEVINILKYAPVPSGLYGLFPRNSRPESVRELQYFLDAAVWPDMLRNRDEAERFERYHRGPWHYTNIFWEETADRSVRVRDDLLPEAVNILERLHHLESMATDSRYPKAQHAIVIAWLEHLVGDVHQPLHTSARVTAEAPEGDRGGNLMNLEGSDNLHWYWDRRVSDATPRRDGEGDVAYTRRIAEAAMTAYPLADLASEAADHNFESWVERGFELASTQLYDGLTEGEAPSAEYARQATEIAERAVALAGYRLGALMNRLFG